MTAALRVEVERLPNSIVIPAEAVFDKGGRMVAYVLTNGSYQERTLNLGAPQRRAGAGCSRIEAGRTRSPERSNAYPKTRSNNNRRISNLESRISNLES